MYGGRAPKGSYAIKLMYGCMHFKQRFYRPVTVLESLKRFLHIIARKKASPKCGKISLCINQCWNSLNLINVQFLTNALGNYVWLTEKWSGLMKLKLFWRRSKTNWRRKLRLEGENIDIIKWNITTKFLSRRFTYQSFFTLGHSYVSKFLPFCAVGHFLWGFVRFYLPVTVLKSLKRFLYIIARKKSEPTIRKKSRFASDQCWIALNLINVQFLTNAFGNYAWLTEK